MKSQILQVAAHVVLLTAMSASAAIRHVNVDSASPALPYTNWTTAAALSVLRLFIPASGVPGVIVSWQSASNRNYFLESGTNLGARPAFLPLATGIVGQPGTTTFTDTNAVGAGPFFYRVGVQ